MSDSITASASNQNSCAAGFGSAGLSSASAGTTGASAFLAPDATSTTASTPATGSLFHQLSSAIQNVLVQYQAGAGSGSTATSAAASGTAASSTTGTTTASGTTPSEASVIDTMMQEFLQEIEQAASAVEGSTTAATATGTTTTGTTAATTTNSADAAITTNSADAAATTNSADAATTTNSPDSDPRLRRLADALAGATLQALQAYSAGGSLGTSSGIGTDLAEAGSATTGSVSTVA